MGVLPVCGNLWAKGVATRFRPDSRPVQPPAVTLRPEDFSNQRLRMKNLQMKTPTILRSASNNKEGDERGTCARRECPIHRLGPFIGEEGPSTIVQPCGGFANFKTLSSRGSSDPPMQCTRHLYKEGLTRPAHEVLGRETSRAHSIASTQSFFREAVCSPRHPLP